MTRVYGNGQDVYYKYDADGQLMQKVHNGVVTGYLNQYAEKRDGVWVKYYYLTLRSRELTTRP